MEKKKCSKCNKILPVSSFYFIKSRGVYNSPCLKCSKENNEKSREDYKSLTFKPTKRLCNGALCRGEKEFVSRHGERFCRKCTYIKNTIEDWQ